MYLCKSRNETQFLLSLESRPKLWKIDESGKTAEMYLNKCLPSSVKTLLSTRPWGAYVVTIFGALGIRYPRGCLITEKLLHFHHEGVVFQLTGVIISSF